MFMAAHNDRCILFHMRLLLSGPAKPVPEFKRPKDLILLGGGSGSGGCSRVLQKGKHLRFAVPPC